jgi:uncharacterized protein YrrD
MMYAERQMNQMDDGGRLAQEYKGKPVISVANGQVIGHVADILIDPETLSVAALITSRGSMLNRRSEGIPASEIRSWGDNAIMVEQPEIIQDVDAEEASGNWISVFDGLRGRYLVTSDGTRVGRVNDVFFDQNGHLLAYHLGQVDLEEIVDDSKRIDAGATRALGKDVIVIERKVNRAAGR